MAATDVLTVVLKTVTNIDEAVKGFNELTKSIKKANTQLNNHNKMVVKVTKQYERLNANVQTATGSLSKMENTVDAIRKKADTFKEFKATMLAISLGALFFGMAMKRFFGGIARGAINAYMEIQGRHGEFVIGVNRLAGAWEFLKFSIMDALAESGTLDWILETIIGIVEWFTELSPKAQEMIGKTVLWGLAIGTVLMIIGQIGLGITMLTTAAKALGVVFLFKKGIAAFTTLYGWIQSAYTATKAWLALSWAAKVTSVTTIAAKMWSIAVAAGVIFIKIVIIVAVILLIAAAIVSVYFAWDNLVNIFKIRIKQIRDWFTMLWETIKFVFAQGGRVIRLFALNAKQWIADAVEGTVNRAVGAINTLIRTYNKLNPLSRMREIEEFSFGVNVKSDVDALKSEMDAAQKQYADNVVDFVTEFVSDEMQMIEEFKNAGKAIGDGWKDIFDKIGFGQGEQIGVDPRNLDISDKNPMLIDAYKGQQHGPVMIENHHTFHVDGDVNGVDDLEQKFQQYSQEKEWFDQKWRNFAPDFIPER